MSKATELPFNSDDYCARLESGCSALGLQLSPNQRQKCLGYLALFLKWNRAYNLSAISDPAQMVSKHLLDSLTIAPHIIGERFVDVGTGAGLPGIPLAILFPERHFTLLDSNGKKTRFLFQAQQSLGLDNIVVNHCRVEDYQPSLLYDGVLSRAFASLGNMLSGCKHLLTSEGFFFAMKGIYPQDELREVTKHYKVVACHDLQVPDLEGERCLIQIGSQHK